MSFVPAQNPNPRYATPDNLHVTVDVDFRGATLAYMCSNDDSEAAARDLFNRAIAGQFGEIAPYSAPIVLFDPAQVKSECQRRIFAVASQNAQMNMTAYVASGLASNADKTAFAHSLEWVAAMRAASAGLIDDQDVTFANDAHWPACPSDVAELASRF